MNQLDMIFGKPGDTAVDPICRMMVLKSSPPGDTADYQGKTYYFCAPGCKETFLSDPDKWSAQA
ncbi:MAG: YHS domain-containing protein [Dehalococcoidia bacterium]